MTTTSRPDRILTSVQFHDIREAIGMVITAAAELRAEYPGNHWAEMISRQAHRALDDLDNAMVASGRCASRYGVVWDQHEGD